MGGTHMAKRKTLPKDFEQLVQTASDEDIKKVLGKCDINAYGGYNKGNALEFPLSEEMMRWLIGQGIDINYVDQYGYTPLLYHAGRMASEKQAIALVKLGADITATQGLDRETVMHVAVKTGNLELVKCLIQAGADAEVTSRSGETPLERAFHWARTFDLLCCRRQLLLFLRPLNLRCHIPQGILPSSQQQVLMIKLSFSFLCPPL
jgi:ankyrin repeat protein